MVKPFGILALALLASSAHAQGDATSRLFDAIDREDLTAARAALAQSPSWTAYNLRGDTPLTAAAEQGNAPLFQLVLAAAPDINQPNRSGRTALITAVWLNQGDVLRVLLPHHPNLDLQDQLGESAIFYAESGRNDTVTLKMLLGAGANPNLVNKAGQTALSQAITYSQYEAAQVLRAAGAHEVGPVDTLYAAVASNDISRMRRVLEQQHFDPNTRQAFGQPFLCVAAQKGNTAAVRLLLEHGADPNMLDTNKQPPLYWALTSGHGSTVDALLDAHADVRYQTPGHRTMLMTAAYSMHDAKLLQRFLNAGIDVNIADVGGQTALIAAAQGDDPESVRLLLKHGADPTVVDHQNRSAYWYAKQRHDDGLARLLDEAAASWAGTKH